MSVGRSLYHGNPLVRRSRVVHAAQRARANRGVRIRPERTDRPDLLEALRRDGLVVLPGYVAGVQLSTIKADVTAALDRAKAGEIPQYVFAPLPDVFARIAPAEAVAPATSSYFQDPLIRNLMKAYISPQVASHRHEIDHRFGINGSAQADLYHFDNWRPMCKAFLYLVDVDRDTAPFVYVKGTHRPARWRRRYDIEYDAGGADGRFGHLFPQEFRSLQRQFGWADTICTGAAGTLILADLRGLHHGTPLVSGERVMLTNVFDMMNREQS